MKWGAWREDTVDLSGGTILDAKEESTRVKLYEATTAVLRVPDLLDEYSPKVWQGEVPEFAVITLIPSLNTSMMNHLELFISSETRRRSSGRLS